MATINWSIKQVRKNAAQMKATNPVLEAGQLGLEADTKKGKVGPGAYNSLSYEPQIDVVKADENYEDDLRLESEGGAPGSPIAISDVTGLQAALDEKVNSPIDMSDLEVTDFLVMRSGQGVQPLRKVADFGGKEAWEYDSGSSLVQARWNTGAEEWQITDSGSGDIWYRSSDDVPTVLQVTSWNVSDGVAPTPTFEPYSGSVQEVLEAIATGVGAVTSRTLYVDAENGDDDTAVKGRKDKPYQTIQAAINTSVMGDGVEIASGEYTGPIALKNGVDLKFGPSCVVSVTANATGAYVMGDNNQPVVCSVIGRPKLSGIGGTWSANRCFFLRNAGSSVYVELGHIEGNTGDLDPGVQVDAGYVYGTINRITTTGYDGVWLATPAAKAHLRIAEVDSADNPVEITGCDDSVIEIGFARGNGINVVAANGDTIKASIKIGRSVMFGPSIFQATNGGEVSLDICMGDYDAGGGIGITGICSGVVVRETSIRNASTALRLEPLSTGYDFDGGKIVACDLDGGNSITASEPAEIIAIGSRITVPAGSDVTVRGDMQLDTGAASAGDVPTANADGTWSWA